MPELPEVETIRRSLLALEGHTISKVELVRPKSIKGLVGPEEFVETILGRKLEKLARRGKYLLWELSDQLTLVIHLRMTGQLLWYPEPLPISKHTTAIWHFQDLSGELRLEDMRTFATISLVPTGDWSSITGLYTLGPEPFSLEFSAEILFPKLKRRSSPIKTALLDQKLFAGVGNIYADEALYRTGIHPLTPANSLSKKEVARLIEAVEAVLKEGIENHGTSFRNYVDGKGEAGAFQNKLAVYGRRGEACFTCGREIERIAIGGRGSFHCPHCQQRRQEK